MRRWVLAGIFSSLLVLAGCAGGRVSFYARTAPPPIRVESYGPAPGPNYVWVQGYWGYRGDNYVWVPGRWDRPPKGHSHWESGRWEHHGDRYVWHDGRWR